MDQSGRGTSGVLVYNLAKMISLLHVYRTYAMKKRPQIPFLSMDWSLAPSFAQLISLLLV